MNYNTHNSAWGLPQVSREHYLSPEYLSPARFAGLQAQLQICLALSKDNEFLEIGPGPGLFAALLRHFGYQIHTLDFANDLRPDFFGKLPQLPFCSKAFDVVCAFEVLEHIPFEALGICLREMRRVARKRVILSLPDQQELHGKRIKIDLRVGRWTYKGAWWHVPFGRLTNPKQHFWELGFDGVSPQTVVDVGIRESLTFVSSRFVSPWFHYFIFDVG